MSASQVSMEFAIGVYRQHGEAYANRDFGRTLYHACISTRKEKRSKNGPRPRLTGFEERRTQATFDENPASDNRTRRELACQLGSQ